MEKIDKNVIWLGYVSFFMDISSSIVSILLPVFVVYVLDAGVDKLGIVIAVATFVSYIFRIFFGYLSDHLGIVKPFVVAGYAISALSIPLLAFTHSYAGVAMIKGFERMGKAVRSAPKDALISAYSQKNYSGRTFGFHKMMDISGELGGALIILAIFAFVQSDEAYIRTVFAWSFLPGLIAVLIMLFFVKDTPPSVRKKSSSAFEYTLLPLLLIYFFFLFFLFSDQYLILKAREEGFGLDQIPLFIILFTLTQALTSYYSGVLIDKKGSGVMLLVSFVCGLASMLALALDFLWSAFILLGLFTVISLNAMRSYISESSQSKGGMYGLFYAGVALFASLGALVMGYVWEKYGFEQAIGISLAGLSLLTFSLAFYLRRQKRLG